MNAVEIEEAISELASAPFDAEQFPRAFLESFNNKQATVKRLLASAAKNSDVAGGVLQYKNIHLAVAEPGNLAQFSYDLFGFGSLAHVPTPYLKPELTQTTGHFPGSRP